MDPSNPSSPANALRRATRALGFRAMRSRQNPLGRVAEGHGNRFPRHGSRLVNREPAGVVSADGYPRSRDLKRSYDLLLLVAGIGSIVVGASEC